MQDNIAHADRVAAMLQAKADTYIARHAIAAPEPEPPPDVPAAKATLVSELDLAAQGITTVIWCTGFTGDLSWVRAPILDRNGRPRHRRCAAPVPGLWYLGFPWLTRRSSGILYGLPSDAAEVARGVVRHLARHS